LVPSKADGFGIVYAEAASFGVPSLAFGVMGVTEAIRNEISGWTFSADAAPKNVADKILECWMKKDVYKSVCKTSYEYAATNFDWSTNIKIALVV
jgi:glycosyltransferase involved in cell wall biosynthesis